GNGREDFKGLFVVRARAGCAAPPLLDLPQYPVRPPAAKRVQKVLRTLQRARCQLLRTAEIARSDASRAQIGGKVQFMLMRLEPGKVVNRLLEQRNRLGHIPLLKVCVTKHSPADRARQWVLSMFNALHAGINGGLSLASHCEVPSGGPRRVALQ